MKDKISLPTIFSGISMICMIIITITVLVFYRNTMNRLDKLQQDEDKVMTHIETVAQEIDNVAADIEEANLPGIAENINNLTADATDDLATTMEKIDSIDIEGLNNAIGRLDAATESLENAVTSFRNLFPTF